MTFGTDDDLTDGWIFRSGRMFEDATGQEISRRIKNDLREIARTDGGWTTIYVDPGSGQLWRLSYIDGSVHGGGPRRLGKIDGEPVE